MRLPLLQVRDLRIAFNQGEVVKGVSFNLALGEKLALVGESGSGKSVLALSLVKLIEGAKLSGRCLWTRQDEQNLAPESTDAPNTLDLVKLTERQLEPIRGQDIAFVFQEPMTALNPVFSVGEQIAEVLQIKRGMTREEAWHEAIDLIKVTGIAEPVRRAKSYPHQLSGGQRQRVMIAMALACRPRLLIADEPTTALDVSVRSQILDLLDHLQYRFGMAVLLITHDLEAVRRFADRVLVMEKGLVVEQGEAKEVLTQPQHAYTQKLLNSQPIRDVVVPPADAPVMLQGWGLGVQYPASGGGIKAWFFPKKFTALQDVNFVLRQGHTLGVIGESGSGKTSLTISLMTQKKPKIYRKTHHHMITLMPHNSIGSLKNNPFKVLPEENIYGELTESNIREIYERIDDYSKEDEKTLLFIDDFVRYCFQCDLFDFQYGLYKTGF